MLVMVNVSVPALWMSTVYTTVLPTPGAVSGNEVGAADFVTSTLGGATGAFVMVQLTTSPGLALMPIEPPLAVVVAPPTTVHPQPVGRNAPALASAPSVNV